MIFKKIAIIGVGLIGGSIGAAVKKRRLAGTVVGIGHRASSIDEAIARGAIDKGTLDAVKGVAGADLVIIATPVCLIPGFGKKVSRSLKKGCIVTDVGSTKSSIVGQLEKSMPAGVDFVGSHPLAGSEKRGVVSAREDLFKGSVVIMTKTKKTDKAALKKLGSFWKSLGAGRIVIKSPEEHDRIVAQISHLPHIAAAALVNSASDESLEFASTGFRDATRIAASDPGIWRDICVTNRKEIVRALDNYARSLAKIKKLVKDGSGAKLRRELERSRARRESLR
ncbi:MAG: prephenate dehydrogenase [Candidatus Omnitrophica bacterium]|nr:prephenate dehydrogenase [Candidatus Omnitrophota bacterium]